MIKNLFLKNFLPFVRRINTPFCKLLGNKANRWFKMSVCKYVCVRLFHETWFSRPLFRIDSLIFLWKFQRRMNNWHGLSFLDFFTASFVQFYIVPLVLFWRPDGAVKTKPIVHAHFVHILVDDGYFGLRKVLVIINILQVPHVQFHCFQFVFTIL